MHNFKNDYSVGAHPNILNKLIETNLDNQMGYGDDDYSIRAKNIIREKINNTDAEIHFVSGGTQANLIVISSMLKPYESIIAADSAHIAVHETGAIEATGHKINTIKTEDGKLSTEQIQTVLELHTNEHMVKPRAVFISNSTELGTIYTLSELSEISAFCKENNLFLYIDGARLGSALASSHNDINLTDIANLVDAFYIGGTKNGALLGEAIVIINKELQTNFRFYLKQKGALLAKGRVLGIQFIELFKNDLYFSLAKHANTMAMKIANAIKENGYSFFSESTTNQIFPILPIYVIDKLSEKYLFHVWQEIDKTQSAIRLITSWGTQESVVNEFIKDIKKQP